VSQPSNAIPLTLHRVAGPDAPSISVSPDHPARLGRAIDCDIVLADPTVSRQHCVFSLHGGRWFVSDLGSRAGTLVNALPLPANQPAPLDSGDLISIGPWLFRVGIGGDAPLALHTIDDASGPATYVETINEHQLGGMAQQRLAVLLDYAGELNRATTEPELAQILLRCAVAGSGNSRAAVVRPVGEGAQVEVIARLDAAGRADAPFGISRSLVREAAAGRIARLTTRMAGDVAVSIADLGIHSALAIPMIIDAAVVAILYLDARGGETRVRADAADFCVGLAKLCGLAYANLKRDQLEARRRELESELAAAREAQQLIVPVSGRKGALAFRLAMHPGSFVAGDLFDVLEIPGGRVAVCIGDVTGHGVGAGLLMAAAQSHLNAALRYTADPAKAVAAASAYLASHSAPNRFVSLWVGVFDPASRTVVHVDAGHGHWMLLEPGAPARVGESEGGPPIGVDTDYVYPASSLTLPKDAAILLYSDGIIEQRSPTGEMFGRARVRDILATVAGANDPTVLLDAVKAHAGTTALDDDATAAIIRWHA
jgi:serine phosphatase RsbU (regulator of sigma subunit)